MRHMRRHNSPVYAFRQNTFYAFCAAAGIIFSEFNHKQSATVPEFRLEYNCLMFLAPTYVIIPGRLKNGKQSTKI